MAEKKNAVIAEVKSLVRRLKEKHDIDEAYLFGSWATGKPEHYSDVDIAVVLKRARKRDGKPFDEAFEIFHEGQEYDSSFEIVCFSRKEFLENRFPIVRHIKKEGKRIL